MLRRFGNFFIGVGVGGKAYNMVKVYRVAGLDHILGLNTEH
jgi:hypothetical protein